MGKRRYSVAGQDNRATVTVLVDGIAWTEGVLEFWAPADGGYVRHITDERPGLLGSQVCRRMGSMGSTLIWYPSYGPLVALIQREMRLAMYDEVRDYGRN